MTAMPSVGSHPATAARVAAALIATLLVVTPLIVVPDAKEAFRLVKMMAGGCLGIASLVAAAFMLRQVDRVRWATLLAVPSVQWLAPLCAAVLLSWWHTVHTWHAREATADFAIAVACLIGWSIALPVATLRRLLDVTVAVGAVVALLVVDQAFGVFGLLDGLHVQASTTRLALTSTLGNPGDVGAYLVLPLLLVMNRWHVEGRAMGAAWVVAGAAMLAGLVVTATLAALVAVVVGGGILWWLREGRRLSGRRLAVRGAVLLTAFAALLIGASPLRARVESGVRAATALELNTLLTGRLDGWRAATRMWQTHRSTGVGHGAFRAEFADTRLALQAEGVEFLREQHQVMFATPHNEALSVAAETGLPGLVALAWALWALTRAARVHWASGHMAGDGALAQSGLAALAILCLVWFPFHVAAVAWPWVTFLAWMSRASAENGR